MTIHWKSLALVLTGVLLGCASNAAQTAYAESEGGAAAWKCLGPSGSMTGVEEDLNALAKDGYTAVFITQMHVCGKR